MCSKQISKEIFKISNAKNIVGITHSFVCTQFSGIKQEGNLVQNSTGMILILLVLGGVCDPDELLIYLQR